MPDSTVDQRVSKWITELQSIAQTGLAYTKNVYDIERFQQLMRLTTEMADQFSSMVLEDIQQAFAMQSGYATPKIDVRGFILKDDQVLLVRERQDNCWTLPGGWSEVNLSPSENVLKEVREETGYTAKVLRLLALWDKQKHDHPPQWPHAYKAFFHCEITGGKATPSIETSAIEWFNINELPELSTPRVTASQLKKLYDIAINSMPTPVD